MPEAYSSARVESSRLPRNLLGLGSLAVNAATPSPANRTTERQENYQLGGITLPL